MHEQKKKQKKPSSFVTKSFPPSTSWPHGHWEPRSGGFIEIEILYWSPGKILEVFFTQGSKESNVYHLKDKKINSWKKDNHNSWTTNLYQLLNQHGPAKHAQCYQTTRD